MKGLRKQQHFQLQKHIIFQQNLQKLDIQTEKQRRIFPCRNCTRVPAAKALAALEEKGILGGFPLDEHRILWCCTEVNTKEEMDAVVQILKEVQ